MRASGLQSHGQGRRQSRAHGGETMTIAARISTVTAMAGMLLALPVLGADTPGHHGAKASSPTDFIKNAAGVGMAEVQLGTLAQERASSDDVKTFAKRMVDDHTKANTELEKIAQKKHVTLPKELDAKHKALYDRLSKLSGSEFDRAYMNEMLSGHREVVAEFQRETKSSDADVRDFATRTLPTIEQHLASAEQIKIMAAKDTGTSTAGTGQHRATAP
jgi:putative membrane protein